MKKIKTFIQKLKNIFHLTNAFLANVFYGFPSKKITVIGVTGTDGKTTTTHLIAHILKSCGKKVSYISTIFAKIGEKEYDTGFHVTTPNPWLIQKLIKEAVNNKDEYFILETTSHALDQNRVWGINYKIGVLTNVTHEHLDYHLSYEDYLKTKVKLLKKADVAFFNKDDRSYLYIKKMLNGGKKIIEYQKLPIIKKNFPNLEKFNQENFSAAYLVALSLGLKSEEVLKAIKTFKLPKGRLDLVYDKDFKVIIDFAHTPNAFLRVLPEIRRKYLKGKGRLIHVFGAAGLRDDKKRPLMGEIAGQYDDLVILTEEDYRTESLFKICEQIAKGLIKKNFIQKSYNLIEQNDKKVYTIFEKRQDAINFAIKMAKPQDVVVLTGKSHEKSLCRGKIEYPWDEYKAVKIALKNKR
jgi:UDP-N-acetylmuramoyl-L-alanyl-D-glutamate--2,6-diaminopimelate ligase